MLPPELPREFIFELRFEFIEFMFEVIFMLPPFELPDELVFIMGVGVVDVEFELIALELEFIMLEFVLRTVEFMLLSDEHPIRPPDTIKDRPLLIFSYLFLYSFLLSGSRTARRRHKEINQKTSASGPTKA